MYNQRNGKFLISGEVPEQDDVYEFAMENMICIDEKVFELVSWLLRTTSIDDIVSSICEFFEKRMDKSVKVNFLEDKCQFEMSEESANIPIVSKNSGAIGCIRITGKFSIFEALGLLAFYNSLVSIIEGIVINYRLQQLLRSGLDTLYKALNRRARLTDLDLDMMERIVFGISEAESTDKELCSLALKAANVGLVGVRDDIFERIREGGATGEDYSEYLKHVDYGYEILKDLELEKEVLDACLYHHEFLDGSGPKQLKNDEIPKLALIIGIAEHVVLLRWGNEKLLEKYPDNFIKIALKVSR
ncbi:MAG TPA: phosphohydrolase [Fervidobacterium sp.]|nr:phosphohydrolase [Fervidobacterium sp.]HRD19760.1 HD domain-containing phosphohydrolase [Fervidobacterium sp.]